MACPQGYAGSIIIGHIDQIDNQHAFPNAIPTMGKQPIPVTGLGNQESRIGADRYPVMIDGISPFDVCMIQKIRLRRQSCHKVRRCYRVDDEGNRIEIVRIAPLLYLNVLHKAAVKPLKALNAQGEQLRSKIEKSFKDLLALRCRSEPTAQFSDRAGKRR